MTRFLSALILCLFSTALNASPVEATVVEPFLELRSGPGRGYPVTRVVPRGENVWILLRRTDWFRVVDQRGAEGWARREQIEKLLMKEGGYLPTGAGAQERYGGGRREAGLLVGSFWDANAWTGYVSDRFDRRLSVELRLSQSFGDEANGSSAVLGLVHALRPDQRVRPFVALGAGVLHLKPAATTEPERVDPLAFIGAGLKADLSSRFIFRAEYNRFMVFNDLDDDEEPTEWKLGFAYFF